MNGRPDERADARAVQADQRDVRADARDVQAAERDRLADERDALDVEGVDATAASAAATATSAALTAVSAAATASRAAGIEEDDDPDVRTDAAIRALEDRGVVLESLLGQIETDVAGIRDRLFRPVPNRRHDLAATMGGKRAG